MKLVSLSILVLWGSATFAQNTPHTPEMSAEFPGGFEKFYQYVSENLVYPFNARAARAEGRAFVEFEVDEKGKILSTSVRVLFGVHSDFDAEVVRVIRGMAHTWTPARDSGRAVKQTFVLPIVAKLTDDPNRWPTLLQRATALKAVVAARRTTQTSALPWPFFSDLALTNAVRKLNPGDSVEVIGWAPSLLLVSHQSLFGYVSSYAVTGDSSVVSIVKRANQAAKDIEVRAANALMKKQRIWSKVVPIENAVATDLIPRDQSRIVGKSNVFLNLDLSSSEVVENQCVVLDVAVWVKEKVDERYRFINLERYMSKMNEQLYQLDGWHGNNYVRNVERRQVRVGDDYYSVYSVYTNGFCPFKVGAITIPPLALDLSHVRDSSGIDVSSNVEFRTNAARLNVKKLNQVVASASAPMFSLVGRYSVTDSVPTNVEAGRNIPYSITIEGAGSTFALLPPKSMTDQVQATLMKQSFLDTVINNQYYSRRTFDYSLQFKSPGTYHMSHIFHLESFDPTTNQTKRLHSERTVVVADREGSPEPLTKTDWARGQNIIAIDVSQSMLIEDYQPNRLQMVLRIVSEFLAKQKDCDIRIMLFAGEANPFPNSGVACYEASKLISAYPSMTSLLKNGTSIGEALWASLQITSEDVPNKVVIIGDGDNTSGAVAPQKLIKSLVDAKTKVFAVGVGHSGKVPFGRDANGQRHLVEDTFSDATLRMISSATGGQYYFAHNPEALTKALESVFRR